MDSIYVYEDEQGDAVFRVKRFGNKQFSHEHPENGNGTWTKGRGQGDLVPYRLPEVLEAIDKGRPVYVCEGEKDVETARLQGVVATTNSGGAGKWRKEHSFWLRGAEPVIIVWDRDDKGKAHALQVAKSLQESGVSDIQFRRAAKGKDLTDHVSAGLTLQDLAKRKPRVQPLEDEPDRSGDDDELLPSAFQLALTKLNKVTAEHGKPNQYNAMCPAHDDTNPSLSIRPGDSVAVMVHCFANECAPADIARALGINPVEFTRLPTSPEDDQETKQDFLNEQAYMQTKAREHAQQRIRQERARHIVSFGERDETALDELAIPLAPIKWIVDSWFRTNSSVIMNADAKSGKTRLAMNLVQSLTENKPFLGHYNTTWPEDARIWYGNWDMPDELFREYMHDYQWKNPESFIVQHLGPMEMPFWVPDVFDDFMQYAKRMNIKLMIVDTLHVASQGYVSDMNDNDEVSQFIHLLRQLCKAAEIDNLLINHHTGHGDKSRGRGASTLAADTDGAWLLKMEDPEQHDSPRLFSAKGRKLGQSPVELVYSMGTETYTTDGKPTDTSFFVKRVQASVVKALTAITEFEISSNRWPTKTELWKKKLLPGDNNAKKELVETMLDEGWIEFGSGEKGRRGRAAQSVVVTKAGREHIGL